MYGVKEMEIVKAAKDLISRYCLQNHATRQDVADELGIKKGTLDNKLKPSMMDTELTGTEIMELTEMADDNSILDAMERKRGRVAFDPIEVQPDGGDLEGEVISGSFEIDCQKGELAKIIKESLEGDGKFDEIERENIANALKEMRKIERKLELMLLQADEEHELNEAS